MNILLNIIWVVFGGLMIAIEYAFSSLLMMLTIIGIPFGVQTIKLAQVALWPFGTDISSDGWPRTAIFKGSRIRNQPDKKQANVQCASG